jgi:hypothetical protein
MKNTLRRNCLSAYFVFDSLYDHKDRHDMFPEDFHY